jgi:hypothetical protein
MSRQASYLGGRAAVTPALAHVGRPTRPTGSARSNHPAGPDRSRKDMASGVLRGSVLERGGQAIGASERRLHR